MARPAAGLPSPGLRRRPRAADAVHRRRAASAARSSASRPTACSSTASARSATRRCGRRTRSRPWRGSAGAARAWPHGPWPARCAATGAMRLRVRRSPGCRRSATACKACSHRPGSPRAGGRRAPSRPGRCVVVGAGLAGAAVAASLARRGWQVTVLDAAGSPGRRRLGLAGGPAGAARLARRRPAVATDALRRAR